MARANTIQTNFTSGELSPNMYGRVDITKYFNGARKLRAMIPQPQGGLIRCPGTQYLGSVYDKTKKVFVRQFSYSENDSYLLEFGHLTLRVWQSGSLIATTPTPIVSPYSENDLAELRAVQSADVLFLVHPSYAPRTLTRTSSTVWTFATYANEDGPYMSTAPTVPVTLSAVTDRATATASASTFTTTGGAKTITGAIAVPSGSLAGMIYITAVAHGFSTGDSILIAAVGGVPESVGAWVIYKDDADHFILCGSVFAASSAYTSGGTATACSGSHVEYREDNLWKLAQIISITSATVATVDISGKVLYLDRGITSSQQEDSLFYPAGGRVMTDAPAFTTDDGRSVLRVNRTDYGTLTWHLLTTYWASNEYYSTLLDVANYNSATQIVKVTDRSNTATLTADSAYFASTDVGRKIRLRYGEKWVPGTITAYTSTTVVTVSLDVEVPTDTGTLTQYYNNGRTDDWKIGAWGSVPGYPAAVAFHQDRLVFASTTAEPTTKWMTKSGDYYTFEPSDPEDSTVGDDNAINVTLVSRQVNRVRWMESGPVLLVGTEGAEWQIKPSSIQQTLTPTNISATVQTSYGSKKLTCWRVGSQTLFVDRSGLKLRELTYDFSIDAYAAKDISILSEHILRENSGVVDWSIQTNPYTIIWLVMGNGKVVTVTYEHEHEVIAWAIQDFSDGIVTSCCTLPSATGEDETYFVVARTIDGVAQKFIERITDILSATNYSNCGVTVTYGSPTNVNTLGGFSHLAGDDAAVMVDGVYVGLKAVNGSGQITLGGYSCSRIDVGLLNTPIIGILDPEGGSQAGSSQGKKKRVTEAVARLEDSWYFKTASNTAQTNSTENLSAPDETIDSSDYTRIIPALVLNTPSVSYPVVGSDFALFSGDVTFSVDDSFDTGGRFQLVQDEPYPLQIMALMLKLNTNE